MADKGRELYYLQALQERLADFPAGMVVADEDPDFLIATSDGTTLGIEVRQIFKASDSRAPKQAVENEARIRVSQAQEEYISRNLPGVDVAVTFSPHASLEKSTRSAHAIELLEAVANHIPEVGCVVRTGHDLSDPWEDLPNFISHLRIFRPLEPYSPVWTVHRGGWLQEKGLRTFVWVGCGA